MTRLVVVLTLALVATSSPVSALVLCTKKSGAMFLREACKKKEQPVDPVALNLQGPSGDKGDQGDPGAAGSSLGYALIKPGVAPGAGTLDIVDEARSKNVTDANVFHPQTGVYCFKDLPFTPKSVIATMQYEAVSGGPGNFDVPYARTDDGPNICFTPNQAYVVTLGNGTVSNLGVFVVFN